MDSSRTYSGLLRDLIAGIPLDATPPAGGPSSAHRNSLLTDGELFNLAVERLRKLDGKIREVEKLFATAKTTKFIFLAPPTASSPDQSPTVALDPKAAANSSATLFEAELTYVRDTLTSIVVEDPDLHKIHADLGKVVGNMDDQWTLAKTTAWLRVGARKKHIASSKVVVSNGKQIDDRLTLNATNVATSFSDHYFTRTRSKLEYATHLVACFWVVCIHLLFGGSRNLCQFALLGFDVYTDTIMEYPGIPGARPIPRSIPPLPKDLQTALKKFEIDPIVHHLVQCPKCTKLYWPKDSTFPAVCNNSDLKGKLCGERLGKTKKIKGVAVDRPRKVFEFQSPTDWIGRQLSRPRMEALMDNTARTSTVKTVAKDIWDASEIHEVAWPDGKTFKDAPKDELRLVCTIAIDWFNPFHNRTAGKKWSIGAIYMTCLNIPADIRFRPENICLLGVIPGPSKPSAEQMNCFLLPIVEDLKPFWETGKFYTQTADYEAGRLVRALIMVLICDLDASRGLAGFVSHSAKLFCSYCLLTLDDIENFDPSQWTYRTYEEHVKMATAWKDAKTSTEREEIAAEHGLRWSVLLELGYFNPLRHTALDVVHNMLLGNLKRHCRNILKMDVGVLGGDGVDVILQKPPTKDEMTFGRHVMVTGRNPKTGREYPLVKNYRHVLYALCAEYQVLGKVKGRHTVKANLAAALQEYVRICP